MRLTRTGYGIKALLVLFCFGLQNTLLDAKAIKKSKHAIHKSASKKHDAPKGSFCVNHSYCVKYSDLDCASEWVELNCPRMCRLCEYEGPDIMKLPAVLYYKKGNKKHGITKKGDRKHIITSKKYRKHNIEHASKVIDKRDKDDDGGRRDVVFLSRPSDYSPTKPPSNPPTTSYSLFDYKSNYRNWLFLYPEEHPVHMQYVDQGKAADPNQQNGSQQQAAAAQDASAAAAAPATGTAETAVGASAPPAPAAPAAAAPAVAPAAPVVGQTAAPAEAAPAVAAAPSVAAATNPMAPQVGQAATTPVAAQQPAAPVAAQPAASVAAQQPAAAVAAQQPAAPVTAQQPAAAVAAQQPAAPVAAQQPAAAVAAQQPAAAVAAQQPVAAQAEAAANQTIQLLNQTVSPAVNATFEPNVANVSQANETIMVGTLPVGNNTSNQTVAPGTMDLTTTGQSFTQDVTVDPQAGSNDQSDYSWTCCTKQPRPKDCKKCPDLPKAPPLQHVFNVYCDDLYKDCAYGYSNCNDTWWQIHCPKRCNLCKAQDQQNTTATQTQEIYPNEVKSLSETSKLESDLVAPAPGKKPLVAKYTLRVKPKLLNGVPQTQEIRIMPPNKAGTAGYVKPLMVLKQNITKPMIENIEIDVPQKGAKFSSKPSVEVIEGDHTEMLKVSKGQAIVEDPVQKSKTQSEEIKETKLEQDSSAQITTDQTQSSSTTQAAAQTTASYQPETQTKSPLDTQVAQTTIPLTQSSAPVTQPEATATQADTTTNQADTSATQPAAFTTPAAAAPVTPDVSATQTAAYTNSETCTDDGRCKSYTADRCSDPWLTTNCKSMCKLC